MLEILERLIKNNNRKILRLFKLSYFINFYYFLLFFYKKGRKEGSRIRMSEKKQQKDDHYRINNGAHGGIYETNDKKIVCKISFEHSESLGLIETSLREISALIALKNSKYIPKIEKIEIDHHQDNEKKDGGQLSKNVEVVKEMTESNGKVKIFMKRYSCSLDQYILQKKGVLSEETIRIIMYSIVRAVWDAKQLSIVHRDLKPQNILIDCDSDNHHTELKQEQKEPLPINSSLSTVPIVKDDDSCHMEEGEDKEQETTNMDEDSDDERMLEKVNDEFALLVENEKKLMMAAPASSIIPFSSAAPAVDLQSNEKSEEIGLKFAAVTSETFNGAPASVSSLSSITSVDTDITSSSSSPLCLLGGLGAREIGQRLQVVVADWGICRFTDFAGPAAFTNPVQTLWYRDPHLLLYSDNEKYNEKEEKESKKKEEDESLTSESAASSTASAAVKKNKLSYETDIEIWSIATIMYELYTGRPAFISSCEIEALFSIFEMFGTPTNETWPGVEETRNYKKSFPKWEFDNYVRFKKRLSEKAKTPVSESALDLIVKLFQMCPEKRMKIEDILSHEYFSSLSSSEGKASEESKSSPLIYKWNKDWMSIQNADTKNTMNVPSGNRINSKMRSILISWMIELLISYKMLDRILFLAVYYLDIFLSKAIIKKTELQLVGVTCIFLAEKIMFKFPQEMSTFIEMTDNTYNEKEMIEMEKRIVRTLDFQLFRNTEYSTLHRICKKKDKEQEKQEKQKEEQGTRETIFNEAKHLLYICLLNPNIRDFDQEELSNQILDFINHVGEKDEKDGEEKDEKGEKEQKFQKFLSKGFKNCEKALANIFKRSCKKLFNTCQQLFL
jgi:serine/threonine protein kinase